MKKVGKEDSNKDNKDNLEVKQEDKPFNYEHEQAKIQDAIKDMPVSAIDAAEKDNAIQLNDTPLNTLPQGSEIKDIKTEEQQIQEKLAKEDAPAFFIDPEENNENIVNEIPQEEVGHQLHSKEFYEEQIQKGFQPAIEVTQNKAGFTRKERKEQLEGLSNISRNKKFKDLTETEKIEHFEVELAKPASQQDLSNLDESMIMNMPQIKATSFRITDMLNPKPKDPTIRFRWANCKNNVAGNLGRYLAIGFKVASLDDVDQKRTPIDATMIDGTQVKYFDIVLLKINVLELMGLYKSNVVRSIMKLGRIRQKGIAEARRQFASDINEAGEATNYNKVKASIGGQEPVEFYTPGFEESDLATR